MANYVVAVKGTWAGQEIRNVFGWTGDVLDSAPTEAEAAQAAAQVAQAFKDHLLPRVNGSYAMTGAEARDARGTGVVGLSSIGGTAGLSAQESMPSFVCARYVFKTATPGRSGTGRTGLPGVAEGNTVNASPNTLMDATVAANQTAIDGFLAAVNAGAGFLSVISKRQNKVARPVPLAFPITSAVALPKLGSRLSRLR